ncbi:MAG TPA: extracellular solute-binding protein [Myxococcota bacterium]|jgi:iron(III) transport system substrate-binding protein|nr:extracellular solute-binding protein [Myxococcota bacterium]
MTARGRPWGAKAATAAAVAWALSGCGVGSAPPSPAPSSSSSSSASWPSSSASGATGVPGAEGHEVVVYTSVDQVFSEPVLQAFEAATGVKVRAVYDTEEAKSTGVLNRLLAEAASPRADVFWSGDPVRPFVLVKRGLVAPYVSPEAAGIPAAFKAADGTWTGFAARARVLLVNTTRVAAADRPRSVRDLADPRWKGAVAVANPLFGTTTMHVAALVAAWGEPAAHSFLDALKANGVRLATSNGDVKRLVAAGEVAFGLCDTDDAHEALADGAPVEVVYPDQDPPAAVSGTTAVPTAPLGTLVMPTSVVVLKGGPHPDDARRLVDFLLSAEVERRLADAAAHMPLRAGVPSPPGVRRAGELRAMTVDFARVADAMEADQPWLREWVGL